MNKDFYFFGKLFFGLSVFTSLIYSAVFLLVGPKIMSMDSFLWSFPGWTLIQLAASLFVLKYYQSKGFTFVFSSGWVVVILNLVVAGLLLVALKSPGMQSIFISIVRLSLVCGVVYGAGLIFSVAGKIPLLRWAGIVMMTINAPLLIMSAWAGDPQVNGVLVKIDQWTSLVRSTLPILFMIQFSQEAKSVTRESGHLQKQRANLYSTGGLLALLFAMVAGFSLIGEGLNSLRWEKVHARQAEQLIKLSETRIFTGSDGEKLTYLLTKPLDYDRSKKYPLVVCLSYGEYFSPPADLLMEEANRIKYPAFLFIPYTTKGTSWGGTPDKIPMVHKDELLYEALIALDEPGIDPTRVYVSGVSLGGYGSWHMAAMHPEMFAAAIPVCGEGDPGLAQNMTNVAVWAFHGANDVNVPVSGSRNMIEALKNAGADPRYTEFADKAHNIWHEVSHTPGLLDWLFAQKAAGKKSSYDK